MSALILTHADADSLCSGALALSVFRDAEIVFTNLAEIVEDSGGKLPRLGDTSYDLLAKGAKDARTPRLLRTVACAIF